MSRTRHGPVQIGSGDLDRLMPMCLILAADGTVRHVGPTLRKLMPGAAPGRRLWSLCSVRRPAGALTPRDLLRPDGRVTLDLGGGRRLRGLAVPTGGGCLLLNLSTGLAVLDEIERHGLTASDFAPTDLALELLYLVEARSAVLRESERLNARLKEARRRAEEQALSDALTGLGNRRGMEAAMDRLLAAGTPFGLIQIDLDFFKQVNDSHGHAAGDHVLGEVAAVLRAVTRPGDLAARVGGDEFLLVLPGATDPAALSAIGERLLSGIARPIRWQGQDCRVAASVGITSTALYPHPDADRMLSDADEALYASKRAGRGRMTLAEPPGPPP